ncbi:nuclear transport factor 2 family protein [Ramlibacter henchirensis]|uniref:Nuclear transport factor 2 family protein n=1 Tax=Ramlibacter henchirensis TaxID=204072 RepID=A0A4Z0C3B9_9BURK|nr:nuclear transport factor 2 family protein [Ramlibacter henchirensis]TFZ05432.1 nuclear transport factor 2 family protein [Ramlibacter henchirensis]
MTTDTQDGLLQRIAELEAGMAKLQRRVTTLEDTEQINKLTRMYGYYLDKALWDELLPLFTEDCEVEISALGVYVGRAQLETLFRKFLGQGPARSGPDGLLWGQMYNHMMVQGIVHVDDDGRHARGRWRSFMQLAEFRKYGRWGEGVETFEYGKNEAGQWRISRMHFYRTFHTPYEESWATAVSPKGGMLQNYPPDRPPTENYDPWPGVYIPPFHYANPITGRAWVPVPPAREEDKDQS